MFYELYGEYNDIANKIKQNPLFKENKLKELLNKQYSWELRGDKIDVDMLLVEFIKFLIIKVTLRDYKAEKCSPSFWVDRVWHLAVLYTRLYNELCTKNLGGEFIHHNPDGAFDDKRKIDLKKLQMLMIYFLNKNQLKNIGKNQNQIIKEILRIIIFVRKKENPTMEKE